MSINIICQLIVAEFMQELKPVMVFLAIYADNAYTVGYCISI